MTEHDFTFLRELLLKRSGLSLSAEKRYLVESRLGSVCRQLGLKGLPELIQAARAGDETLSVAIVEAMTTNETLFFRDTVPFTHLREVILPALIKARATERTLRIWCAAASSGQEPYSVAMIIDDMAAQLAGWRVEILATDISTQILERARLGIYSQFEVQRGLPVQLLLKHFTQEGDRWRISERLRRMVTFRHNNLVDSPTAAGTFDLIMCRNILIYLNVTTKSQVFNLLAKSMRGDGYLILGAAETIMGLTEAFSPDRDNRGIYRPSGHQSGPPVRTVMNVPPAMPRPEWPGQPGISAASSHPVGHSARTAPVRTGR
jgi:chemotaxis protein methyltransferase CheR